MIETRYADENDLEWLLGKDDVTREWGTRCVRHREYIIAHADGNRVGFLRYSLFWGKVPYMDMIRVLAEHRNQGTGTALFKFWEMEMRRVNRKLLMTSSQENEPEPQAWHVRNGFFKSGRMTFGRLQTIPEVFFVKELQE